MNDLVLNSSDFSYVQVEGYNFVETKDSHNPWAKMEFAARKAAAGNAGKAAAARDVVGMGSSSDG